MVDHIKRTWKDRIAAAEANGGRFTQEDEALSFRWETCLLGERLGPHYRHDHLPSIYDYDGPHFGRADWDARPADVLETIDRCSGSPEEKVLTAGYVFDAAVVNHNVPLAKAMVDLVEREVPNLKVQPGGA